jgi:hypothetical protein
MYQSESTFQETIEGVEYTGRITCVQQTFLGFILPWFKWRATFFGTYRNHAQSPYDHALTLSVTAGTCAKAEKAVKLILMNHNPIYL